MIVSQSLPVFGELQIELLASDPILFIFKPVLIIADMQREGCREGQYPSLGSDEIANPSRGQQQVFISILLLVLKSLGTLSTSGWRSFRHLDFVLRAFGTTADIRRQGHQCGWRIFSCRLTILSGNANGIGLCEVYPEFCM